jgi:RHS repeat-associated protein
VGAEENYQAVSMAMAPTPSGTTVVVSADPKWLLDPARVWPVVIDPTIDLQWPVDDCYIQSGSDPNQAHCQGTNNNVGVADDGFKRRTLMRWDLSAIPSQQTVLTADLSMYLDTATHTGRSTTYNLHAVKQPWTAGGGQDATWNKYDGTQPWQVTGGDFNPTVAASTTISGSNVDQTYHWYPTGMVQDWLDGSHTNVDGSSTNNGVIVKQATEPTGTSTRIMLSFGTRGEPVESQKPKLTVTYGDGLGELKRYKFETQDLNDRTELKVNVASGNLILKGQDLQIKGTAGHDLSIERYFNSFSSESGAFGTGWTMNVGQDVRLEPNATSGDVTYVGPSGFKVAFRPAAGSCPLANVTGTPYKTPDGVDGTLCKKSDGTGYVLEFFSRNRYNFDSAGVFKSNVDKNGNKVEFFYSAGKISSLTDTHGRVVEFDYTPTESGACQNPNGLLTKITDKDYPGDDRIVRYCYDSAGRLLDYFDAANDPDGPGAQSMDFLYDGNGRISQVTDQLGNVTRINWDGTSKRPSEILRAYQTSDQARTGFTYNPGQTCSEPDAKGKNVVNDPNAHDTSYCYDGKSRVVKVIDAKNKERKTSYNSRSNVTEFTEPMVSVPMTFSYASGDDDLTGAELATGGETAVRYTDSNSSHFPTRIYDFQNHNDPNSGTGATYAYTYDQEGNLTSARDGGGNLYEYGYNDDGTLDYTEDAKDKRTDLTYVTTGVQKGDLKEVIPPAGAALQKVTFGTDEVGRVSTITFGNNVGSPLRTMRLTYDRMDRVELVEYWAGAISGAPSSSMDYGFDDNGNLTSRQEAGPTVGTINFGYDRLNRLISETPPNPEPATQYGYWPNGDLHTLTYSGDTYTYEYDSVNMLTSLTEPDGVTKVFFKYHQNRDTLRVRTDYPGNVYQLVAYDDSSRVCQIRAIKALDPGIHPPPDPSQDANSFTCDTAPNAEYFTTLTKFSYDYSDSSDKDTVLRQEMTGITGAVTTYRYDLANRLEEANVSSTAGIDFEYRYDSNSNLDYKKVLGAKTSYFYSEGNELCWSVSGNLPPSPSCGAVPTGGTNYDHDAFGNMTFDGGLNLSMAYNVRNQMSAMTPGGGPTLDLEYQDADSTRLMKAETTEFGYNLLGMSRMIPGPTSSAIEFVRDDDQTLVEQRDGNTGNTSYYLHDGLGSVVGLTRSSGALIGSDNYRYTPTGTVLNDPTTGQGVTNPWKFASGFHDSTTGLYKFGTRYYDSGIMRWTQLDPEGGDIQDPLSLNRYLYVGCNPVNRADPTGRAAPPPPRAIECSTLELVGLGFVLAAGIVGMVGAIFFAPFTFGGSLVMLGNFLWAAGAALDFGVCLGIRMK